MMKNKDLLKVFFVIMLLALISFQAHTQEEMMSPEQTFSLGNNYYERGEYDKAINEYEKVVAGGHESGPLYFNLAGAYFKSGRVGNALQNYERAKRLIPRDADLASNYRFANAMVKGKVLAESGLWAWSPLKRYYESFTLNEFIWLSSGMYLTALVLIGISIIWPGLRRSFGLIIFILIFVSSCNIVISFRKAGEIHNGAITVAPSAEALFGPFETATKFFTLHEGMKVTILKSKDDWYKVRRADGKVGWVKAGEVEKI